jgi:hypothetical protein
MATRPTKPRGHDRPEINMAIPLNPLSHPVCLAIPERLAPSAWVEHIPFAMWLTAVLRPRMLVELGTYHGTSYCAFCQAIAELGLATKAFAVDTWEGDPHAGSLGPGSLADLRLHHDNRYRAFSTLLQMPFDDAVGRFSDGEIDLLHIDGYHTYEAVRHDFDTWRGKLSERGVVLFHDVREHAADFGVWTLWDELRTRYPSFTFDHEHGLGVLVVGSDVPEEVGELVRVEGVDAECLRSLFRQLGNRLRLRMELDSRISERDASRADLESTRRELDERSHSYLALVEWNRALTASLEEAGRRAEREQATRLAMESELSRLNRVERELAELRRDERLLREQIGRQERELAELRRDERLLREQIGRQERELADLQASLSWRWTRRLASLGELIAPRGSRRRGFLKRYERGGRLSPG